MRHVTLFAIALAALAFAHSVAAQDPDLILYFDYETIGTTVPDLSGKGHDGVVQGDITQEAGKRGMAARFAQGAYIDLDGPSWPAEDMPRTGMSVLAWVNVDNLDGDHAIFNARASDQTWVIHPEVRKDGNFRWLLRTDGGSTIFDIRAGVSEAGTWKHFAGVYDSAEGVAHLYIDGEEVGSKDGTGEIAKDWGMGARVGKNIDDARPFTGLMDDLNIWKRGLTQDEVRAIMENGPLPNATAVQPQGKLSTVWADLKRL